MHTRTLCSTENYSDLAELTTADAVDAVSGTGPGRPTGDPPA